MTVISSQPPIGSMSCGQDMPTQNAHCLMRKVTYVFYCAPLDDGNPMYHELYGQDASHRGITDSASYLTGLPYVVVDADTGTVIYPYNNSTGRMAQFPGKTNISSLHDGARWVHMLPAINIPDNVTRVALHIANDASDHHRSFRLFPWQVPDAAQSKVHVYEVRSDFQSLFGTKNHLGDVPQENSLQAKPGTANEYYGYLTGDLWLRISHEFTDAEITRLCPPETLSRRLLPGQHLPSLSNGPQAASQMQVGENQSTIPSHAEGLHVYVGAIASDQEGSLNTPTQTTHPPTEGNVEQSSVDWTATLAPIYSAGTGSRSMSSFTVRIPTLNIVVTFTERSLANAVNTSDRTTVQQALRRTSPRTFAAILKAAWRQHIDTVSLSSSWRPMLGSRLHKMGVGLDVTRVDDSQENIHFVIRNHAHADRNHRFPTGAAGQKMAQLYEELNGDSEVSSGAVYTPWVNWIQPHDTHMHITVKDD